MTKSPDAFRTISEVATWLGVQTHVLRFWESKFTQVKPVKRAGGRRYYRPADMRLLGGIKTLLHDDGMTIKGVQKVLREQGVAHVADLSPQLEGEEEVIVAAKPAASKPATDPTATEPTVEEVAPAAMIENAEEEPRSGTVLAFKAKPSSRKPAKPKPETAPAPEEEPLPLLDWIQRAPPAPEAKPTPGPVDQRAEDAAAKAPEPVPGQTTGEADEQPREEAADAVEALVRDTVAALSLPETVGISAPEPVSESGAEAGAESGEASETEPGSEQAAEAAADSSGATPPAPIPADLPPATELATGLATEPAYTPGLLGQMAELRQIRRLDAARIAPFTRALRDWFDRQEKALRG